MGYFNARDVEFYKKSIVLEKYKLEKKAKYQSFDVFLSHSSQDRDILPSIINVCSIRLVFAPARQNNAQAYHFYGFRP